MSHPLNPTTVGTGRRARLVGTLLGCVVTLVGCAVPGSSTAVPPDVVPRVPSVASPTEPPGPVATARQGRPAPSSRIRFQPTELVLPGHASAPVVPATTVDGDLKVPEEVSHVGWWDGSADAGDPFGSTVIAGHVDSATEGLGFFVRLQRIKVGDTVTVRGAGHHLNYRVTSVQTVLKKALASDSEAFDQTGDHRLVLITCGGAFHRDQGGYDSNIVVIARPLGLAR